MNLGFVVLIVLGLLLLKGLSHLDNPRKRVGGVFLLILAVAILGSLWFVRGTASVHLQTVSGRASRVAVVDSRPQVAVSEEDAEQVTVVLTPPDKTADGKADDGPISVKIQTHKQTGKGTVIHIKANRVLEELAKSRLDAILGQLQTDWTVLATKSLLGAIRRSAEEAGPKPPVPPMIAAVATASGPATPGSPVNDPPSAKTVATAPSKPSSPATAKKAKKAPRSAGNPGLPPAYQASADDAGVEVVTADGVTEADCDASLNDELERAFARYVEQQGFEAAGNVRFPASEIRNFIVPGSQVQEDRKSGTLGPIIHTSVRVDLRKAYQRFLLPQRLGYLGGGLGAVLLLFAVVYGYLKVDLATAGAYRWRLRLAVTAILLGTAGVALVIIYRLRMVVSG